MKHKDLWRALDTLAAEHGLSVSALARRAGLDPTTFIPAKRRLPDGRARWPNTESLAKVLEATRTSLGSFSLLVAGARTLPRATETSGWRLPLVPLPATPPVGFDTLSGSIAGPALPGIGDPDAYALAVADDRMAPVFREGDIVIASPAAPVRCGDRVVLRLNQGALLARELLDRAARHLVLRCFSPPPTEIRIDSAEVVCIHRIVWASQ
ncbi:MAG: S24 family peptidase [Acetobacteraceae bacterium]